MPKVNWWLVLAWSGVLALVALFWIIPIYLVRARDADGKYANSPNKEWFESQRNSVGQWCCNDADGHVYHGDYKINEDGSVTAEGFTIEEYKVLKGPNPMGAAVWWYVDLPSGRTTFCFSPGSLT